MNNLMCHVGLVTGDIGQRRLPSSGRRLISVQLISAQNLFGNCFTRAPVSASATT